MNGRYSVRDRERYRCPECKRELVCRGPVWCRCKVGAAPYRMELVKVKAAVDAVMRKTR
jgi:hypothetical protein